MIALVTGGAGFIGSHIAEHLVAAGHRVRVFDNFSAGKRANLSGIAGGQLEVIEADVRDAPRLEYHMAGCDVVFHQAAVVSVPYSVEHPQETHDVNLQGTMNVLFAAKRQGVKRIVFAGSAAVYGEDPELPKRETMRESPISPYGVEKLASELYLRTYEKLHGVESVTLRYFNVFGPRQDPRSPYSGVISILVDRALRNEAPTLFGDGNQSRDFVFVRDVVQANLLAATVPGVSGRVYNVGGGRRTTLNELVAMLGRVVGRTITPHHGPPRAGDIRDSLADIGRARTELGYEPRVTVEEGLAELVAHVQSTRETEGKP
ncbi:SDR family oxidoreductase [Pendulispora albinea]|uniref:SDR family oxidoreductase n=1 Tax=Pendulispora albinea TaxID=2741071 RepID=A0ABZ2LTC4_9BACT